jgi:hypothetical protein
VEGHGQAVDFGACCTPAPSSVNRPARSSTRTPSLGAAQRARVKAQRVERGPYRTFSVPNPNATTGAAVGMSCVPYWVKPAGRRVWKSSSPAQVGRTAIRAILVPGWSIWAR